MTTTVAIVNWNSGQWLRVCIESLFATGTQADILVIDNASEDGSMESVADYRNKVNFIRNSVNRGFAAGINQAFGATSTEYVMVLNPDIRVLPGSVFMLHEFMATHPRAGAVGGYVNDKYLPRGLPTTGTLVRENLGFPRHAFRSRPATADAVRVDQPAAAALMIRREAFDEIGGFDDQFYPAWYEDVDFCTRMKQAGWEIYFLPRAEFFHEGGYSARNLGADNFTKAYYSNQLRYARKHLGSARTIAVRASIAAGMVARMFGRPKKAAAYLKVVIGALGRW
ncbi:MAG: glycosyltransferase family 2 protein [Acidobacteria bacterium]|nr:glycosyltransferase family 2 protein [Acidobacteriota bacterium]